MILSGRRLNDAMADHVGDKVTDLMTEKNIDVAESRILILGFSFKENCPDYRNTKIVDLFLNLKKKAKTIDVYDPWVDSVKVRADHNIKIITKLDPKTYDAVILAVAHDLFSEYKETAFKEFTKDNSVIYDLKHFLPSKLVTARL